MRGKEMQISEIDRRRVLQCAAALIGASPFCCRTPPAPAGSFSTVPGRIVVDLQKAPELRRTGAAVSVVDEARKLNLILIHADRGHYVAMDRSCTHNGAQCTYDPKRRTLQCTSLNHAEYDLRGTLLHGRTHGDLRTYRTESAGSTIAIYVEEKA